MRKLLVLAVALLTSAPSVAFGYGPSPYSIGVINNSKNAVWVTSYVGKSSRNTILQARCYLPGQSGSQYSANNATGGWVLFEIKRESNTCANHSNLTTLEQTIYKYADIKQEGTKYHIAFS